MIEGTDETSEWELALDTEGKLIDYLEPDRSRPNTPEERNRQIYARILSEDYGYKKECMAFEAPVRMGRDSRKRADIVIFHNKASRDRKDLNHVRLIVEVKASDVTTGREQLYSYIFPTSAEGGVWYNGAIKYYRRNQDSLTIEEYPGIPREGQTWDTVGAYKKQDLIVPGNLKSIFRRCHNSIYKTGINSEDVAMDMVRILLAKYTDETNPGQECEFRCTPSELSCEAGRSVVSARVRALFVQVKREHPDVFSQNEEITCGDMEIASVVTQLQQYSFLQAPYDVIGTAYETYVSSHLKGERGQYFTNRLIVDLMVNMIGLRENDVILDPACGSGGFLLRCLSYVSAHIKSEGRDCQILYRNRVYADKGGQCQVFGLENSLRGSEKTAQAADHT